MTEINWLLKLKNVGGTVINPRKEDGHGSAPGTPSHVSDLAAQTTLALIKAKTDNLNLALSDLRDALRGVDGKTLSDIAGTDFATSLKQDPLAKYRIADIDKANPVKYYGFAALSGAWVILREDRSVSPNTYRYVNTGAVDYPTAWTNRAALTYVYPYQLTNP